MRIFAALGSVLACSLGASLSLAQPAPASPAPAPAAPSPAPASPAPAASSASASPAPGAAQPAARDEAPAHVRDTLAGHVVVGGALGVSWPLGRLDGQHQPSDLFGPALALNLDLGYGISRYVAIGAWGELDSYSAPDACKPCSGKSYAGGPFIRYHLAQGTRFDPWASYGLGFRSTRESTTDRSYSGFELARIALGGDFYPFSNIGFGPYLMMNIGTYTSHPAADAHASNRPYLNLAMGLRLVIDLPGK